MPNWKKVIVSGSSAELNSLNVTSEFTASGLNYPTSDGTDGQALVTDGAGGLTFGFPTNADDAEKVTFAVQNDFTSTLQKGTPIHVTSTTNGTSLVIPASASDASTMPAHGILNGQLAVGVDGEATIIGQITGVDTSTFSSGDTVYVGPNGGYTNVKPQGSGNLIQNLGIVKKVDASNGTGEIFGTGRSNDVPNLPVGKIWVGSSTYTVTSSVAHLDETNNRLGINTNTPGASLDVIGDISGSTTLTIGSSHTNTGTLASIAGGCSNTNSCAHSFIGGGRINSISGFRSSIVGGSENCVEDSCNFIGGGQCNTVSQYGTYSSIAGGFSNCIVGGAFAFLPNNSSFIGGGSSNIIYGGCGFIGGGCLNEICDGETFATIGGGRQNQVDGDCSVIAGGYLNCARGNSSFIGGGCSNSILVNSDFSTIAGGEDNYIDSLHSFIGGGKNNCLTSPSGSIAGGFNNADGGNSNVHILGSGITADKANYTFVNNLQADTNLSSSTLTLSGLANQASEATAVMINSSNVVGTRELGSNAFNSTAFTTCTGTVTSVGGTGTVSGITLSGTVTSTGNLTLGGTFLTTTSSITNFNTGVGTIVDGCGFTTCTGTVTGTGTDNQVMTSTGGTGIQGEANLTFDGSTLKVTGDISGSTTLTIGSSQTNSGTLSSIAGGVSNVINTGANCSFIGGGCLNTICASELFGTIGGGRQNRVDGDYSAVVGGYLNCARGNCSFIGGGYSNDIACAWAVIGGGCDNCVYGSYAAILGGRDNYTFNSYSAVVGGYLNCARGACSFTGGGYSNDALGSFSVIAGGYNNTNNESCSFIGGGSTNTITGTGGCHIIVGGGLNCIDSVGNRNLIVGGGSNCILCNVCNATIGGGTSNKICRVTGTDFGSTIAGGCLNCVLESNISTIGGGCQNLITGSDHATIAGGHLNTGSGDCSFIGGGSGNTAAGTFSYAGGEGSCTTGAQSFAHGYQVVAGGGASVAFGALTQATSANAFAINSCAQATAQDSFAAGFDTRATGCQSVAFGYQTCANGNASLAGGGESCAVGDNSVAWGTNNRADGTNSFALGCSNTARNSQSFVVGISNQIGASAGTTNTVFGASNCICAGERNFIGGGGTNLSNVGNDNFIGGQCNSILNDIDTTGGAVVFGCRNCANGCGSFSFTHGKFNNNFSFAGVALGQGSSAARGDQQFAFGCCVTNPNNGTTANIANSMVIGRYNVWNITDCHLFAVGNGSSDVVRANAFNVSSNGRVGIGCTAPQTPLDVNGTARVTTLVETSAKRYKQNIVSLQDQLDNIKKLKPVEFEWKETQKKDIGLIAEDVEKIYPQLVEYDDNGDLMGVKYSKITSILIKALQQQQEQIEGLKKEIFLLKQNK